MSLRRLMLLFFTSLISRDSSKTMLDSGEGAARQVLSFDAGGNAN